jgi:hypothetical protein
MERQGMTREELLKEEAELVSNGVVMKRRKKKRRCASTPDPWCPPGYVCALR